MLLGWKRLVANHLLPCFALTKPSRLVWTMFFFECITTLFATISAWDLLGSGWGNLTALTTLPCAFYPLPPLSGFLASMVHFFFCWRIYKLTSIVTLPILIACVGVFLPYDVHNVLTMVLRSHWCSGSWLFTSLSKCVHFLLYLIVF